MDHILIEGQNYRVIEVRESLLGKEILCADQGNKNFLFWTDFKETSGLVKDTKQYIGKHFIAELTDVQVELWKNGRFDKEQLTLKKQELTKMVTLR